MPTVRKLGEGYEPIVEDVDGRLVYSLPVDSSFVSVEFSFDIDQRDLDVLRSDPYRRAVLDSVAHTVLQRSMIRGNPTVGQEAFTELVSSVLHSTPAALQHYVAAINRDHHIRTAFYVEQTLARRGAGET